MSSPVCCSHRSSSYGFQLHLLTICSFHKEAFIICGCGVIIYHLAAGRGGLMVNGGNILDLDERQEPADR